MRTLTVLADCPETDDAPKPPLQPKRDFSLGNHGQSPVDLTNAHVVDIAPLQFFYPEMVTIEVLHTVFSVQANVVTPGAHVILDDQRYDLLQFHTHTPSEHQIAGECFDFELHLVHRNPETGIFVVVGIVASTVQSTHTCHEDVTREICKKDVALEPFIALLNSAEPKRSNQNEAFLGSTTINLIALLPADRRRFRYLGSFTTQPYTEVIDWNVIAQPVSVSQETINAVTRFTGTSNTRDIQPTNGRPIVLEQGSSKKK